MEGERKAARIDQKSTFFYFFVFFLKILDIRKPKTPIFERGYHKTFLGQVLTIFQTSPNKFTIALRTHFVKEHLRWLLLHHPDSFCLLCFLQ